MDRAHELEPHDPTAAALATAGEDGRPSVRMVLVKSADEQGFPFFTNYGSRKAAEVDANPVAALCFHWPAEERQVRVEGRIERLGAEDSDRYFALRPRGSRIGAWASEQSRVLPSREEFHRRVAELETRFEGGEVPRPPFWGGYLLRPLRIEFWQGRESRLHERDLYERDALYGDWRYSLLYP